MCSRAREALAASKEGPSAKVITFHTFFHGVMEERIDPSYHPGEYPITGTSPTMRPITQPTKGPINPTQTNPAQPTKRPINPTQTSPTNLSKRIKLSA